ncbi:lipoprotein [Sphingomonas sp. DBB INV C78]|uniref:DUF1254 domain-containing protein n=1 Tax=Sphingomonas sp. DBB INV C78 TaxID=3349434 RepID=UPI0036D34F5A
MKAGALLVSLIALMVGASPSAASDEVSSSYDPGGAAQHQMPVHPDRIPADPEARRIWARSLAYDATIYGTMAVIQYQEMHRQAVDRTSPDYTGFNRFAHSRTLAGPGYAAFKTPNADTLYSNAWLDLTRGPVLFDVPEMGTRYFTANFIDAYGNASNISARTRGFAAGRYLIAPVGWQGTVPEGVELFRVATPYMWVLLRVLVDGHAADIGAANTLQDGFRFTPFAGSRADTAVEYPPARIESALDFFRILDFVLRSNGHPEGEEALVQRYHGIGVGGAVGLAKASEDPVVREAIAEGYAEAQTVIGRTVNQTGWPVGTWRSAVDAGRYGFNYLYRAAAATLGAGANVSDENYAFTTFKDGKGDALDGAQHTYRLVLAPPPPVRFFWSVTVYDAKTRELHPNPIHRYLISDRTPGLRRGPDGSVTIELRPHAPVKGGSANWLPVPSGPFYLALRAQGPEPEILSGAWTPPPVEPK